MKRLSRFFAGGADGADTWEAAVREDFAFLVAELGYAEPEVDRHFRGNTITHVGSVCSVQNALDEDSGWIACFILVWQGGTPMYLPAWRLLEERGVAGVLRPPEPGGRIEPNVVVSLVRSWASGLQAHCQDALRGENLDERLFRRGW